MEIQAPQRRKITARRRDCSCLVTLEEYAPNYDGLRGIFTSYFFVETKSGRDCPITTDAGALHRSRYFLVAPRYLFPSSPVSYGAKAA
jgi:hypothetical protein